MNNKWHKATNRKTSPVFNPSTSEEICPVKEDTNV
jgi:hypothetical protein